MLQREITRYRVHQGMFRGILGQYKDNGWDISSLWLTGHVAPINADGERGLGVSLRCGRGLDNLMIGVDVMAGYDLFGASEIGIRHKPPTVCPKCATPRTILLRLHFSSMEVV